MNEHFTCDQCHTYAHLRQLTHRLTMPGQYCRLCAEQEKCAACGEMHPLVCKVGTAKYVCEECAANEE